MSFTENSSTGTRQTGPNPGFDPEPQDAPVAIPEVLPP